MGIDNEWDQDFEKRKISLIAHEISNKEILCGEVSIPKYDRENAEVAILSFVGFGSQKIFLLTPNGEFWAKQSGGNITYTPPEDKIVDPDDLKKCEQLGEVIARHDIVTAKRLHTCRPA